MLAKAQNATTQPAAMTWRTGSALPKNCRKPWCAHPDVTAAAIASTRAMIDFHGRAFACTFATCADRSSCGPSSMPGTSRLPGSGCLDRITVSGEGGGHAPGPGNSPGGPGAGRLRGRQQRLPDGYPDPAAEAVGDAAERA